MNEYKSGKLQKESGTIVSSDKQIGQSPKKGKTTLEKKQYFNVLKKMQKKYPKAFTNPPTPLAIGIHLERRKNDEDNMSNNLINRFLFVYTRSKNYKSSIVVGANRVNLEGNVISTISDKDLQNS